MKAQALVGLSAVMAGLLMAADSSPQEEVKSAAKKLGDKANYSWKTTTVVPESSQWRPGPLEGKTEKDGITCIRMTFGDNTIQAAMKGDKGAYVNQEGSWESVSEDAEGPARMMSMMVRNFKVPVAQAQQLASETKGLKKEGDIYAGDLTEEGAKAQIRWRGRSGGEGPTVSDAKGTVKFWVKDGMLSKYEFHVEGKLDFNGNVRDIDRTVTVEIKDVGTTKVEVPEEAKKKLA